MRKIILLCCVLVVGGVAGVAMPYSKTSEDGIHKAFAEFNEFVQIENDKVVKKYNDMKNKVIKNIVDNEILKRDLNYKIKVIHFDEALNKGEFSHEVGKFKNMKNIQGY